MKLNTTILTITTAALGFTFGCAADDAMSDAEQNATYSAAVNQGGGSETGGIPADDAMPEEGDRPPRDEDSGLHRDCSLGAVHDRVMQDADTNGDGMLSDEERAALEAQFGGRGPGGGPGGGAMRGGPGGHEGPRGPGHLRRLMWIYDSDESGDLSDEERAVLEADLEARGAAIEARMLAGFDADGDGVLSDAELEAAREAHRLEMEARRVADLAAYDTDGDGRLSREEMRAIHEARRAALEAQFDADASGALDATEKAALRDYLRSVVRGEVEQS